MTQISSCRDILEADLTCVRAKSRMRNSCG